jgi:transposase-like protein
MPKFSEESLQQAVAVSRGQEKPNISAIARDFNVSRYTLKARLHGRKTLSQRSPATNKFTSIQEQVMVQWVFQLDELNVSPTPDMIRDCANRFLRGTRQSRPTRPESGQFRRTIYQTPTPKAP